MSIRQNAGTWIYILVGVLTFGHAAVFFGGTQALVVWGASLFWPFYWSYRTWDALIEVAPWLK
jgi:hypothetical protein